jgi:hypothetical protein
MNQLSIKLARITASYFDKGEFALEHDRLEEYVVIKNNVVVATFWISNYTEDQFICHTTLTISEISFILQEMGVRKIKKGC